MARALAAAAVALVLGPLLGAGPGFEHQIVNFNYETVQVTWDPDQPGGTDVTFLYRFERKNESECPSYILRHGRRRAGCLLAAEGDAILYFSIWNGTRRLVSRSLWISSYLKPSAPGALRVQWRPEAVTVACPLLPLRGLRYEVQHKSAFDPEWKTQVAETCNVTVRGLDADKCYAFRARATALESYYGPTTYPSDWSQATHLQRGQPRDSCQEAFSKLVPVYVLAALLSLLLLVLCAWKLRRVKRLLMPSVPDPKASFPGLFEAHGGNFQEWIKETQNLTRPQKEEDEEEDLGDPEGDLLEVQSPKTHLEPPTPETTGPPCPPPTAPTAPPEAGTPGPHPQGDPQGDPQEGGVLALGGFRFTLGDNCYVLL